MVKVDNHWIETVLVTLSEKGGSDVQFAAKSEELGFGGAERGLDIKTLLNGGNMRIYKNMTIKEVTIKIFPENIAAAMQLFYGNTDDVSQPLSVTNELTRKEIRVAAMWTDDTAATNAAQATASSKAGIRFSGTEAMMTKCDEFWTNGELGYDVTLAIAPYTTAAVGRLKWESTTTAAVLPALGAYT